MWNNSFRSIPVAAGAKGMGCIGYPDHPAWEVTARCNLKCLHCHVGAQEEALKELTTLEGKKLIEELRKVNEFRMLVYTGGEPLVRQDLFELLDYSARLGFINVIATNATLITKKVAQELKKRGVRGAAVSIDSPDPLIHNRIRNHENAFDLALQGIKALAEEGIPLQINVTAMEYNFESLGGLLELAERYKAIVVLMYQLIPVGRGGAIRNASLDIEQNEILLKFIQSKQRDISAIVEPVAGPQYWPYLFSRKKNRGFLKKLGESLFHGCSAGKGFVYIKANGDVWPCPFININAGNVREQSFSDIWSKSEVFLQLRDRENLLQGKCARCEYKRMCGGCRGRSLAHNGDLFSEDPSCFIKDSAA